MVSRILAVRVAVVAAVTIVAAQVVEFAMQAAPLCPNAVSPARCHFAQLGFLTLSRRENHGVLGDIFHGSPVAAGLALLGCLLIVLYALWLGRRNWFVALAVGLQLGGALSNLFDRVVFGVTADFLAIGGVLIVNLADLAIMAGTILAILAILYEVIIGTPHPRAVSRSTVV
jgi:lipoprotein signal peptidase